MKKLFFLGGLLLMACFRLPTSEDGAVFRVLRGVHVVDVAEGRLRSGMTVVIRDSLIHFVGERWQPPRGARVDYVASEGNYLLPGLWDMHFHLAWWPGNDTLLAPALLANGITGVRDMGGDLPTSYRNDPSRGVSGAVGSVRIGHGREIRGSTPAGAQSARHARCPAAPRSGMETRPTGAVIVPIPIPGPGDMAGCHCIESRKLIALGSWQAGVNDSGHSASVIMKIRNLTAGPDSGQFLALAAQPIFMPQKSRTWET